MKCTKGQLNLEENNFFAYLMEIDLGNQNKTKKHACLRNKLSVVGPTRVAVRTSPAELVLLLHSVDIVSILYESSVFFALPTQLAARSAH